MEAIVELLLELFGEILVEFVLQVLVELGARMLLAAIGSRAPALLRIPSLAILGAALGGATLFVVPRRLLATEALRVANLVITPLLVGAFMATVGAQRVRRGLMVLPIDRFLGGFAFALAFAAVRFALAG